MGSDILPVHAHVSHLFTPPPLRYGPARRKLPGALGSASHLTGQVAGDAGFDPLGLSVDPGAFRR